MPWDMIQPAAFSGDNDIQPLFPDLRARHNERAASDPEFAYLQTLAMKSRENAERTRLSLNEADRRAENAEYEQWRLDLENALRKSKGEPQLASLDELDELEFDDESPPGDDPMLVETGKILLDLIGLEHQVAMVGNETGGIVQ